MHFKLQGATQGLQMGSSHKESVPTPNNMLSCKGYTAAQSERGKAEKNPTEYLVYTIKLKDC